MSRVLAAAIDAQLARDGVNLVSRLRSVAEDYAARGFSEPGGILFGAIDAACAEHMDTVAATAFAVFGKQRASSGSPNLRAELVTYLQERLASIQDTAASAYGRPANERIGHELEFKRRALLAQAERL